MQVNRCSHVDHHFNNLKILKISCTSVTLEFSRVKDGGHAGEGCTLVVLRSL